MKMIWVYIYFYCMPSKCFINNFLGLFMYNCFYKDRNIFEPYKVIVIVK